MQELVKKYKLPLRLTKIGAGDDVEYVAQGKVGHIYLYDEQEELLGAMFLPQETQKGWKQRREKLVTAGAHTVQNGDLEGAVSFPAKDKKLVRLAAKLMGVTLRREMSAEQQAKLADHMANMRAKSPVTNRVSKRSVRP